MDIPGVPLATDFADAASYWRRAAGPAPRGERLPGPLATDVCVVGAGFTGLWTAYYLKRARPDLRVTILEKEYPGFGASGRNGGWVAGEMAGSRERYARSHGRVAAIALQRAMFATVDEVCRVVEAEGIDADLVKSGVVYTARNQAQLARLDAHLRDTRAWGFAEDDLDYDTSGRINVAGALGASWSPHCARIQPAKLVAGLVRAVRGLGVEIYERTPVFRLRPRTEVAPAAASTPYGTVAAEYIIRATEGFTADMEGHHRDWLPMNSSMIVTEPLPPEVWDRIGWNNAELLGDMAHYYIYAQRTADGRIAFGGRGRPYRYGSAVDGSGRTHPDTVRALWRMLTGMFPAAASSRVAHAWSGVLGVPRDWCSSVTVDHRTGLGHAGGYTGTGVATANLAGRTLRDLILDEETELTVLPWVGRRTRRWEPEPLRWLGVQATYALYRAADARERARNTPKTSPLARLADTLTGHTPSA